MNARHGSRLSLVALFVALGCGDSKSSSGAWSTGQETGVGWWMTTEQGSATSAPPGTTSFDPDPATGGSTAGPRPDALVPHHVGDGFVDAFFAGEGLYVVDGGGVELVARDGSVARSFSSPRTVHAAAFDGNTLVVADSAVVTILDPEFATLAEIAPPQSCKSVVVISGGRFVCGPDQDWDRIFYTFDTQTAELLDQSEPLTYRGLPMRRVPGTDDFVTVTLGTSPPDFNLHRVIGDVPTYLNESPYHGDFAANLVQAYLGNPATRLVGAGGTLLRIYGPDGACGSDHPFESECFVKDGELGLLPPDVWGYEDLREGPNGELYGIFVSDRVLSFDAPCMEAPCTIQRIDPDAREVRESWEVVVGDAPHLMLLPDPTGAVLAIVSAHSTPFLRSFEDRSDFSVHFLPMDH